MINLVLPFQTKHTLHSQTMLWVCRFQVNELRWNFLSEDNCVYQYSHWIKSFPFRGHKRYHSGVLWSEHCLQFVNTWIGSCFNGASTIFRNSCLCNSRFYISAIWVIFVRPKQVNTSGINQITPCINRARQKPGGGEKIFRRLSQIHYQAFSGLNSFGWKTGQWRGSSGILPHVTDVNFYL